MSNEAWKDTGDCSEGRRNKYCSKRCTAWSRRLDRIANACFLKAAGDLLTESLLLEAQIQEAEKRYNDAMDAMVYSIEELKKHFDT